MSSCVGCYPQPDVIRFPIDRIGFTTGNRRDKPAIEFDPEIEKTLKKNRSRVKAQRAFQFDQEEVNSEDGASEKSEEELVEENTEEEIQDNMADNANN
ncbi:hypothetical protein PIB30_066145 [Stylosanthes scabra]|uniref:Uncharacterized protein n=1 Tax=Stylosanthes scabra TaxID=79078 RepID=A0ABU6RM44_9FABA|nr:hypothetical protein [Stylosanthes scabra]